MNTYIKKIKYSCSVNFHLKKTGKEEQTKRRASRRKEEKKKRIKMEISETENGKTLEDINKTKSGFFERSTKLANI